MDTNKFKLQESKAHKYLGQVIKSNLSESAQDNKYQERSRGYNSDQGYHRGLVNASFGWFDSCERPVGARSAA